MNEEAYVPSGPPEPAGWREPAAPAEASPIDIRGLEHRLDQLESAVGAALTSVARLEAVISTTGMAHQMAHEMGRPEGAAVLAQELSSIPGFSEAVSRFPILGDMAKVWAAHKLNASTQQALSKGESPLPTSVKGGQGSTAVSSRQRQLAGELQKMASELGISLDDSDAMEVFANV